MKYPMTFYTDKFVPNNSAACMRLIGIFPVIFIRPKYKDDTGIYKHELEHVKQCFEHLLWGYVFSYKFSKKYRLWSEVEAYAEQAKHYTDDRIPKFAKFIALHYNLDITEEAAEKELRSL